MGPNHLLNRKMNKQCNTKAAGAKEIIDEITIIYNGLI
jgi:hypothetical protein